MQRHAAHGRGLAEVVRARAHGAAEANGTLARLAAERDDACSRIVFEDVFKDRRGTSAAAPSETGGAGAMAGA